MQTDNLHLEKLLSDESFQRWISETASDAENQKWAEWLNSDLNNHDIFDEATRLWNAIQFHSEPVPNTEDEWNQLSIRLNFTSDSKPANPQMPSEKETDGQHPSHVARWRYIAIAASIFLIILLWRQLSDNIQPDIIQQKTVHTHFGQIRDIQLSDRAHIVLNANSTIEYPVSVTNLHTIKIKLQGEAYFEVYPQVSNRYNFIVETYDGRIEVAGTKFVIHSRETGTKVVVETGAVEVVAAQNDQKQKQDRQSSLLLHSGNLLKFHRQDRSLEAIPVNVKVHTSWRTDHLVFDNTPFRDIAQRLKETYDVNIKVKNKALLQNCVSGSIENSDPDIIFQAIAKALGVNISKKGNTVFFGDRIEN